MRGIIERNNIVGLELARKVAHSRQFPLDRELVRASGLGTVWGVGCNLSAARGIRMWILGARNSSGIFFA